MCLSAARHGKHRAYIPRSVLYTTLARGTRFGDVILGMRRVELPEAQWSHESEFLVRNYSTQEPFLKQLTVQEHHGLVFSALTQP